MSKNFILLLFLLLPVSFPWSYDVLFASETEVNLPEDKAIPSEEESFQELLHIIEEESRDATESKTNADFVPGIITVLRGDDLEERGVRTVYEALALVPGLDLSIFPPGLKKIVVRGLSTTQGSTDLKLLLNDVPVNNTNIGMTPGFFDIPVALVDRVDIIRGSGAVIYGENASSGVINVITRKKGNTVFGRYGRFDTVEGGGIFSRDDPEKDCHLSLALSGWDTDGADVESGPALHTPSGGPVNEAHQDGTAIMKFDIGDFSLLAQYLSVRFGGYFGYEPSLSGTDDDSKIQSSESLLIEVSHELNFGGDSKIKTKFGFARFEQDYTDEIYSEENGVISREYTKDYAYDETRTYGNLDYLWEGWENHRLTMGVYLSRVMKAEASIFGTIYNPDLPSFLGGGPTAVSFNRFEDENRTIGSVFAQDEFALTHSLNLTAGLRYDYYNDLEDMLTPRLALIYRLKDHHMFKAQYAEGFKASTYIRDIYKTMLRDQTIPGVTRSEDHEKIRTIELGYIYKGIDTDARMTLFHSKIDDLISDFYVLNPYDGFPGQIFDLFNTSYFYTTITEAEAWGVELELQRRLTSSILLNTNLSYVKTKYLGDDVNRSEYPSPYNSDSYSPVGKEMVDAANWLGNFDVIYRPVDDVSLALHYRYVGERHRWYLDDRDKLDSYDTVDLTLNMFNLFHEGLTLRAGLKNIFDEAVVYPSLHEDLYPEDLPRGKREWWVQLSYTF